MIITNTEGNHPSETFRTERLWVTSNRHAIHAESPLPLALGRPTCKWRCGRDRMPEKTDRPFRILYSS